MAGEADPRRQLGKIALQQKLVVTPNARQTRPAGVTEFLRKLGEEHGAPVVDLTEEVVPIAALRLIPVEIAQERVAFPFALSGEELKVAMATPKHSEAVMELEFLAAKHVVTHVAPEIVVRHMIEHAYAAMDRGEEHFVGSSVTPERLSELGLAHLEPSPPPPDYLPLPPAPPAAQVSIPPTVKEEPVSIAADPRAERTSAPTATAPVAAAPAAVRTVEARAVGSPADVAASHATVTQVRAPSATPATGAVVIASSERSGLRGLEQALVAEGLTVIDAEDGNAAIAIARDRAPKVMLLDARLPSLTGWEIARRLFAEGKTTSITIIVRSDIAKDWRLTEDLRETYGVKHVVDPAIDPTALAQIVRLELEGKAYPPPPPALSPAAEGRWTAGIAAFEKGDLDRAIEEMEAGVRIDADAFEMHYHLGLLHGRRDDLFAAIRALDRAVALQPKSFAALKNLAVVCQRAGLRRRARDSWERALSAAPDESTAATIRQHIATGLL